MIVRATLIALATLGCGQDRWEITAENKSDSPCSIAVAMGADGSRTARVDNFSKKTPDVLVSEPGTMPMTERSLRLSTSDLTRVERQ